MLHVVLPQLKDNNPVQVAGLMSEWCAEVWPYMDNQSLKLRDGYMGTHPIPLSNFVCISYFHNKSSFLIKKKRNILLSCELLIFNSIYRSEFMS